jgi:hypothetical protein
MKKPSKAFLMTVAAILAPTIILFGWAYCNSEVVCFWNPWIDTLDDGYSEQAFDQIEIGMTVTQAQRILGRPYGMESNSTETIWLTGDGKCKWGDFAWMGRALTFSNGVIVGKIKEIIQD